MPTRRDTQNIIKELRKGFLYERMSDSSLEITFHYFIRTPSGASVGRHLDNAPQNPWADDEGFITTEVKLCVPGTFIPRVEAVNLVQESYHPNSEIEVVISSNDLFDANITTDDLRNRFQYSSINKTHETLLGGRASTVTNQLWDIRSVRENNYANRLIAVTVGLSLREPDSKNILKSDIIQS